jgi:hypothetical protein
MSVTRRSRFISCFTNLAGIGAACTCLVVVGCTKQQSNAERIKAAYESSGMTPKTLYPLSGTVTVDHQPPVSKSKKWALVVMAYDASKPDHPATVDPYVTTRSDGTFEFSDGGLPPGKYVLLFAMLALNKKQGWHGPDELKNLYNDPDVNGKKQQFTINHDAPGKTDYAIDLSVAGETPVAAPGPKALTKIPN